MRSRRHDLRCLFHQLLRKDYDMYQSPAVSTGSPIATRTRHLLEAPITPTLLRLAMPNVVVMMAQAAVSTCEVYFVGWLGPEALAGVSLVFPLIMLMQTMSAGGMGGGVACASANPALRPYTHSYQMRHAECGMRNENLRNPHTLPMLICWL
jgi:hypothetical protein